MGKQLLYNVNVEEIFVNRENLISVDVNDSVGVAFDKLIKNHILSVPVIDSESQHFYNFLDILDIVHFALGVIHDGSLLNDELNLIDSDFFRNTRCSEIVESYTNSYSLSKIDNLSKAVNTMVSLPHLQRLPVTDTQGNLQGILSQSKLVEYLTGHIEKFPIQNQTLSELRGYKRLVKIKESDTLKDAFIKMKEERISGIAVVDERGKLVGNISASDIKVIGIDAQLIKKIFRPISEVIGGLQGKLNPITVSTNTSLGQIFHIFTREKIHRMYLEEDHDVVGVINLSDILSLLVEYC